MKKQLSFKQECGRDNIKRNSFGTGHFIFGNQFRFKSKFKSEEHISHQHSPDRQEPFRRKVIRTNEGLPDTIQQTGISF